jgi:hypothetical protein
MAKLLIILGASTRQQQILMDTHEYQVDIQVLDYRSSCTSCRNCCRTCRTCRTCRICLRGYTPDPYRCFCAYCIRSEIVRFWTLVPINDRSVLLCLRRGPYNTVALRPVICPGTPQLLYSNSTNSATLLNSYKHSAFATVAARVDYLRPCPQTTVGCFVGCLRRTHST